MSVPAGAPLDLNVFRDFDIPVSAFSGGVPSLDPRVFLERRLDKLVPRAHRVAMAVIHFKPRSAGSGVWACAFCEKREKG